MARDGSRRGTSLSMGARVLGGWFLAAAPMSRPIASMVSISTGVTLDKRPPEMTPIR